MMQKFYSALIALLCVTHSYSQNVPLVKRDYKQVQKTSITPFVRDDFQPQMEKAKKPKPSFPIPDMSKSMTLWEQVIGYTTYDNQTNNSMQQRIILDDQENAHATWTMSFQDNTTWTDRGTGYSKGSGYVWGEIPYDIVETERTGWPGIFVTGDNKEAYVCHTGTGSLTMVQRPTIGSGNWISSTLPTALATDILWPRTVVDGNKIHVIGLSAPTGLGGAAINGVNGNLVYWRSDDNGTTWSVQDHIFTAIDSLEYEGIESDSYAIDARNGKVSIAIFSEISDSIILTSDDNGDTWTSTIFFDFPISGYLGDHVTDIENDGIIDTLTSTDGTGSLLIDATGVSHVAFGEFFFYDDLEGDSLYSVFVTDRLLYWNTNLPTDEISVIGTFQESAVDDNETNDITIAQAPAYRAGLASMPTLGEDADGILYCVFSAADEEYLGTQVFRHLFATTSIDGGTTWSAQTELTPDLEVNEYEYAFPTMVKTIDNTLHIVVMRDNLPGLTVRGDLDPSHTNEIVYLAVTKNLDISLSALAVAKDFDFNVYPNPTNGIITISGENLAGMSVRLYDNIGKEMVNTKISKNFNSKDQQTFDFSYLPNGRYTIAVTNGTNKMTKEILIVK